MSEHETEFCAIKDRYLCVLRRLFEAQVDRFYRAWSDETVLRDWYGPFHFTVTEYSLDFREGGASCHVMGGKGNRCTTIGSVFDILASERFTMTANLEEHPPAWLERFRPPGTDLGVVPTPWIYDVMVRDFERARSLS